VFGGGTGLSSGSVTRWGEPQAVECLLHEWPQALAWNFSLDRLAKLPEVDPAEFDRACHDEA